jgi:hypothetical protein
MFPILVLALPSKPPDELIVSMLGLEAHIDILGAVPGIAEKPGWNAGVRTVPHSADGEATAPAVATKVATSRRGLVCEALDFILSDLVFFQIATFIEHKASKTTQPPLPLRA